MATREQIGGTDAPPRDATPSQAESGSAGAAPGTEIIYGAFAPGWWRHLFSRPKEAPPGGELVYGAFAPGWWRHLFSRPKEAPPGGELVYTAFAPGWWRFLFRRMPPRSPR